MMPPELATAENTSPETAEVNAEVVPALPEPLERGRYVVFPTDTGGWAVARSAPICERCQACGCGDQAKPIMVPPFVVAVITGEADPRAILREVMRMMRGQNGG